MNKIALVAIVSAGFVASHAGPTFAQSPRRWVPRPGQSYNVYRPNPAVAQSVPLLQRRTVVDARGNRFVAAERFVSVWDPSQGRWVLRRTWDYSAQETNQARPLVD